MLTPAGPHLLRSLIAAALLCLLAQLGATEPGPGPMQPPPPPPAAPKYTNPYFTLAWEWTGTVFLITGTVANPNGGPGVTNTGFLDVTEAWALQGGQWVWVGDSGTYSTGFNQTSANGYLTYQSSVMNTYQVPSNQQTLSVVSLNALSTVVNGQQSSQTINLTTTYSGGAAINLSGQVRMVITQTQPTSVSQVTTRTMYNGPPGQQDKITVTADTTYTDATQTMLASTLSLYQEVNTIMNANGTGTVASTYTDNSSNTCNYTIAVDGYGNQSAALLNSTWIDSYTTIGNDANGNQVSSSTTSRSRRVINTTYMPGINNVVQVWGQSAAVAVIVSDNPQVGPAYNASLTRTTTWAAPAAGGYPDSWNGSANNNGDQTQLQLNWDSSGNLTNMVGAPNTTQGMQAYDAFYSLECDLMEMAPPPSEYPFYPNVQKGPTA